MWDFVCGIGSGEDELEGKIQCLMIFRMQLGVEKGCFVDDGVQFFLEFCQCFYFIDGCCRGVDVLSKVFLFYGVCGY